FKHALTQEVAYQSVLTDRRKELHRRAGAAMEATFADRLGEFEGVLAEHFRNGEQWEKAADYLIRAGDASDQLFAWPEARRHYDEALAALGHLRDTDETRRRRVDVLTKRVSTSISADPPERNVERLAEAESLMQSLADGTPDAD